MRETRLWLLGREDRLEKEMAIHSSPLAWKIPWTEEPDRLQSMGSQRDGHKWATSFHFNDEIVILCRPWGASGHKAFVCPISLTIGSSLHSTSMTFPEFKQLLIEEGSKWETKKKDSSVALGQGTISPSKDKTEVSLIYFADTESSSKWEKLIND